MSQSPIGSDLSLAELERLHILALLRRLKGNKTEAASILGIDRTTLYNKLRKYSVINC